MNLIRKSEAEFIEKLRRDYAAKGYEALREANDTPELPFVPDLVLKRGDDVIVLEVKSGSDRYDLSQIDRMKRAVEAKNWRFRLLVAPRPENSRRSAPVGAELIAKWLGMSQKSIRTSPEASIVLLWMALEALMRRALARRSGVDGSALSPSQLARSLRRDGVIDDDDLAVVDRGLALRNSAVHGFKAASPVRLRREMMGLVKFLQTQAFGKAGIVRKATGPANLD